MERPIYKFDGSIFRSEGSWLTVLSLRLYSLTLEAIFQG